MSGRQPTNLTSEADRNGLPRLVKWSLRLAVFAAAILLCMAAGLLLYSRWQDARLASLGPDVGDGTHLSPVRSLYLRGYLAARASDLNESAGSAQRPSSFVISPGQNANEIAANLARDGLLNDVELFLNYLRYFNLDAGLEAGVYEIDAAITIPELALVLSRAADQQIDLTFIEGWRLEEMANYLEHIGPAMIDSEAFLAIARRETPFDLSDYSFLASLPEGATLEGFLFPDTYRVAVDADAASLIRQMLDNFDRQVNPAMRQSYGARGLSVFDAVTLASIVQREAVVSEERPLMVGVFANRLEQNMLLQADPTVQYAVGYQTASGSWWKSPLDRADLEVDSPYNTYRYHGLPPGPIANPGLAALEAVAQPEETEYLYFVVDCTAETSGQHVFSTTFEEHLAHVERCR